MKNGRANTNRKKEAVKVPKNLSLSTDVIKQGEELAKQDDRDLSAQVSWLIKQEAQKRGLVTA